MSLGRPETLPPLRQCPMISSRVIATYRDTGEFDLDRSGIT